MPHPELRLVELEAPQPDMSALVHERMEDPPQASGDIVLDLPLDCMRDERLRAQLDLAVLAVGPTSLHEHLARTLLASGHLETPSEVALRGGWASSNAASPSRPWLLGCARAGGAPAAESFARAMRQAVRPGRLGVLPTVMPPLARREAVRLAEGCPEPSTLVAGHALFTAIRLASERPDTETLDATALRAALDASGTGALKDDRSVAARLRDLSDELDAISEGLRPTPEDLAEAPVLDAWRPDVVLTRVLTGVAAGHPSVGDGRRIATSELWATDGQTWARTLSRYWKLGSPAEPTSPSTH